MPTIQIPPDFRNWMDENGPSLLPFEAMRKGSGFGRHPIGERYASGLVKAVALSAATTIVAQAENSH